MRIAEISIRRPVFATVLSLMLVIVGLVSLSRLPVREYPDIDPVVVSVTTSYRGASAQIVESKITQIIEDRISGLEGITKLESQSADERSNIRIEFDVDRDLDGAANDVRDRISRVLSALPPEADPPQVLKADNNAQGIVYVMFYSDRMSVLELTDYADRYLIDRLAAVPGAARVSLSGERRYAMRIWLDRQALAARALTVTDIEDALRRENVQLPAGRLESQSREFSLRTVVGLDTPQDFRELVIGRGPEGHLVRLDEVAEVELAAENERSVTRANGKASVMLSVEPQSKANILDVARGARAELERIRPGLPQGAELGINYDRAIFVEASLHEVEIGIVFALISVLIVIYLFLGSVRATLIPAVTIPVSIVASFTVMLIMGYSINVLTLLGLVLAIGLVVDDAIVVLENIHRHIEMGRSPLTASLHASKEIGFAVIATTLTLAAVFVPISFLPGDVGRLFREFGFTLAAAVLFSALVALSLTPMMASKLTPANPHQGRFATAVDRLFRRLESFYESHLRSLIRRPWLIVASVGVLMVAGVVTFRYVPSEFAPSADLGFMSVNLLAPEGASFEYTEQYGAALEEILLKEAEKGDITRVMLRVPGGFGGGTGDVNSAISFLMLKDWNERQQTTAEIQQSIMKEVNKLPGVRAFAGQPGGLGRGGGGGRGLQAVIGGPDYEQLAQWSDKLVKLAESNPGLIGVDSDFKERKPQIKVAVDRNRAAELGISLQTVGRTLETVLGSRIVTTYVDRGREYNVILQGMRGERSTPTDLANLYVRSDRSRELIPLSNVVQLEETAGPVQFNRFERMRAITISADLAPGYTMGEAVEWFQQTVAAELPSAARLMFNGEARQYQQSSGQLYLVLLFALAVVFLVLAAQFESFLHPAIIMVSVPLAMLGAVFGLKLTGLTINIFSQIAVIMLIGIAAKNGVLIVEFANQLRERGLARIEAVVKASAARLRPVLMTSLCTAFGALPFLLASGAGAEQRRPIGVVVFYGTMISVLLTLIAVPAVYSLVARSEKSPLHTSNLLDRSLREEGNAAAPAHPDRV